MEPDEQGRFGFNVQVQNKVNLSVLKMLVFDVKFILKVFFYRREVRTSICRLLCRRSREGCQ